MDICYCAICWTISPMLRVSGRVMYSRVAPPPNMFLRRMAMCDATGRFVTPPLRYEYISQFRAKGDIGATAYRKTRAESECDNGESCRF